MDTSVVPVSETGRSPSLATGLGTPVVLQREPAAAIGQGAGQNGPAGSSSSCPDGGPTASFGRRLRDLRLQRGLSQKQLARSSTLSVRAIRDLENGRVRHPRADSLRLLADALGLSVPQMNRLTDDHMLGSLSRTAGDPAVSGPFLGREDELAALAAMLGAGQQRLVTITGIEGVGKTRLALEVARALEAAERWTALWLPLGDDRWPGGREPVGARPQQPTRLRDSVPAGPDSRWRLVEAIGASDGLLVLDGARPDKELIDVTAHLLSACPRLRILVTMRNPAGMPLDTLFPLAPLAVPPSDTEPADLGKVASVALLIARTRRVRPAFRPGPEVLADVARICRALDGLPAALESAALWSLIYSLPELARHIVTEPLTIARRPHSSHRRPDAYASVHDTLAALTGRQRELLAVMRDGTSGEPDGCWSMSGVADRMNLTATECADDIYHLFVLGILRRVDHHDEAMFRVLNLISVAGPNAAA